MIVDALMISMYSLDPFNSCHNYLSEIESERVEDLVLEGLKPQAVKFDNSIDSSAYSSRALSVLKRIGTTKAIKLLLDFYGNCCDQKCIERIYIVETLNAILSRKGYDSFAIEAFTNVLNHPKAMLRELAASALGKSKSKQVQIKAKQGKKLKKRIKRKKSKGFGF